MMSAAQETELDRLEQENRQLHDQVAVQAWELGLLRARFVGYETALRGSQVTVCTQDRDLRFTSISNSMLGRSVEQILGCTDAEILPRDGANVFRHTSAVGKDTRALTDTAQGNIVAAGRGSGSAPVVPARQ